MTKHTAALGDLYAQALRRRFAALLAADEWEWDGAEEKRVAEEFAAQLMADPQRSMEIYRAAAGNIIDPDRIRALCPAYAGSRESRQRSSRATGAAADAFAQVLYEDIIPRLRNASLLFTAGGPGSGKTASLAGANADLIFDTPLRDYDRARRNIERALKGGNLITVRYVHQPLELAMRHAVVRAVHPADGCVVEAVALARAHAASQQTFLNLASHYAGRESVQFGVLDNTGFRPAPSCVEELRSLRYRQTVAELEKIATLVADEYLRENEGQDGFTASLRSAILRAPGRGSDGSGPASIADASAGSAPVRPAAGDAGTGPHRSVPAAAGLPVARKNVAPAAVRRIAAPVTPFADDGEGAKPPRSWQSLLVSIGVHAAIIAGALTFVVSRYFAEPPEVVFAQQPRVSMPAQIREHKMNVAKHDAMAPRPTYSQRLAGSGPSNIQVPEMPPVDLKQMLPLDPSELVSDQIASLVGSGGYGRGTGRGLGGGGGTGTGSGLAFFDIKDNARSVVIMIDVSQSMFSRTGDYDSGSRKLLKEGTAQAFQVIRDEAIKLIDSLSPNSRFGIIRWSGSARSWKPELVRATDANKAAAKEHIQSEVDANSSPPMGGRPGGTRHDYALEELFRLQPEVAFMLTDGNATRTTGRGGMSAIPADEIFDQVEKAAKEMPELPRVHTIYYLTGADKKEEEDLLKGIARKTKGKFRKVEASGLLKEGKDRDKDKDKGKDERRK